MGNELWVSRRLANVAARLMGSVTHVATEDAVLALTFDDGPDPGSTPVLLSILARYRAKATFFMVGQAARQHRHVVEQVAREGHAIGNHSWSHPSFPLIDARERRAQIRACAEAIAPYGQRLFRPPYGHQSVASRLDALLLGYQVITYRTAAIDWLDHDAQWMADRVIGKARPGSIVIWHDTLHDSFEPEHANRKPAFDAVEMVLQQFSGQYRFVTVPELLRYGRPQRRNWYRRASPEWLSQLRTPAGDRPSYIRAGAQDTYEERS
jgi:peptidoglycan/xylan/chitin deacetylase (PgdA/CDA1 family)